VTHLSRILVGAAVICRAAAGQQAAEAPKQSAQSVMQMAQKLQKEIVTLPQYGVFDSLSFTIKDYVVTLKGKASRPTLKEGAENVAKRVEGVEKVVNQIEVLPLSRMDDGIRARVYYAIYSHPSLSRYNPNRGIPPQWSSTRAAAGITNDPPMGFHPIHLIVQNGNVALEGVVANAGDKAIANIQANSVSGVFSVENNLQVAEDAKPRKNK
jgi:hyperosmotically inducible periplasmic protein